VWILESATDTLWFSTWVYIFSHTEQGEKNSKFEFLVYNCGPQFFFEIFKEQPLQPTVGCPSFMQVLDVPEITSSLILIFPGKKLE
jgi:hypothetical protein